MFELVVGVGNPGSEYAQTKHNIAWLFFDQHPDLRSLMWKTKYKGLYAEAQIGRSKFYILKPQTYMNLSGESVQPMSAFYKIEPSKILVVHDELDIPFGQIHFKMGGGFAGHNGLKSIAGCLGTDQFARLRIGIGRPQVGSVANWVLTPFAKDQQIQLPLFLEKINDPFSECMVNGLAKAGNLYNKKALIS